MMGNGYVTLGDFPPATEIQDGDLIYSDGASTGTEQRATALQLAEYTITKMAAVRQSIPVTTANQAEFATQGYTVPLVNVFLIGLRLSPSQYQATDGVNVIITDATILATIEPGMTLDIEASISQAVAGVATPASVAALDPANQPAIGTILGTELISTRQGANLFQTTLTKMAQWIVGVYQSFTQSGTGALPNTIANQLSKQVYVSDFDTPNDAGVAASGLRLVVPAGTTVTLSVPSAAFATLAAAWSAISNWEILGNVTIQMADGTYTMPSSLYMAHPFGKNIHILGDIVTPANCTLNYTTTDAFYVPYGFAIGEINGFYLKQLTTRSNIGVYTDGGKINKCGPNLVVDGFYYGIAARNGGMVNASGSSAASVTVKNAGDVGIWAFLNSYVTCEYANVSGSADTVNNLGGGIVAEFASAIDATYATSTGNYLVGISSLSGSSIRAWNTVVSGNGGASANCAGYNVASLGTMEVFSGTTENNTGYGYATDGTTQLAGAYSLSVNTGNSLGLYYYPFQVKADTTMSVNSGSLTIDSTGPNATGGATYLDQNIPASEFAIQRFLTVGAEVWRQQYRNDSNQYQWSAGSVSGMLYHPLTGRLSAGVSAPAVTATDGFFSVPKMAGAPTGTPTIDAGFAPIVFDSTNNKIWVWTGSAWKGATVA